MKEKRNSLTNQQNMLCSRSRCGRTALELKGCPFEVNKTTCYVVTEKREICKRTGIYHLKINEVLYFEPKLHPTFQHVTRQDLSQSLKSWHKTLGIPNSVTA